MPGRKHSPEEIIGKLREAEVGLVQGATTAEVCRRIAVSEQAHYRWLKEYGGLKTDQARRMKDLEKENARLRRAIPDLTPDKLRGPPVHISLTMGRSLLPRQCRNGRGRSA